MSKNLERKIPNMEKFCVFILSHGRPKTKYTYNKLRKCGYTGKIVVVIDDEDKMQNGYFEEYGAQNVFVFNKRGIAEKCDSFNNFCDRRSPLFARNACFNIAREIGVESFVQMDDDYYYFGHRGEFGAKQTKHLDLIFSYFIEFLQKTNVYSIAFSQGGDHIGGYNDDVIIKRKAMNSFFCLTKRQFSFIGLMNDDVNTYVKNGIVGRIFFTYMPFQLDQCDTQQNNGGITELYIDSGTYVKSFYTVMAAPACTRIKLMGGSSKRLHHAIDWRYCTPQIISEKYKKKSDYESYTC